MIKITQTNKKNPIKGIFICKTSGEFLVELSFVDELNVELLSGFIGALSMFGEESVGTIDEIVIKGWDLGMFIVTQHNLILTALFDPHLHKPDKFEAEKALDSFYNKYKNALKNWKGCIDDFNEFKEFLRKQIEDYFDKVEISDKKLNFWQEILKRI